MKKVFFLGVGILLSAVVISPTFALVNNVNCRYDENGNWNGSGNSCEPYVNWRSIRSMKTYPKKVLQTSPLLNKNTTYLNRTIDKDMSSRLQGERFITEASEYTYYISRQRTLNSLREDRAKRMKASVPHTGEYDGWEMY